MSATSIQQFIMTALPLWRSKPATEKLLAKVMLGLATIAAGNSGYDWAVSEGNQGQMAARERLQPVSAGIRRAYAPWAPA